MGKKKSKKRKPQNNLLVLKLLLLVAAVLVLFEGKLIYTMFTHSGSTVTVSTAQSEKGQADTGRTDGEAASEKETDTVSALSSSNSVADAPLAGLSAAASGQGKNVSTGEPATEAQTPETVSEEIDSPAVVKKTDPPRDDSFFSNAVFIGDSRMEGFHVASGITQGDFLTSVGLSTDAMSDKTIASSEGTISVYQGLSGKQYDKIYLMLGTNDLGYYPWESFPDNFSNVIQQFHKLQPDAVIYVCSVIYVDESKITTSYDNNENVRKINGYLLDVCESLDYCYYLNLNEIFTNGYGSLIEGASSDGIHLYGEYCEKMLDYLKCHYVTDDTSGSDLPGETAEDAQGETETGEN